MKVVAIFSHIVLCLFLSGCLGNPGVQQFIQIEPANAKCTQVRSDGDIIIAIKPFTAPDYLDRLAVLIGKNGVYEPSQLWYWEGSPSEIITNGLVAALRCQAGFSARTPYSPSMKHDFVITGRILSFAVEKDTPRFSLRFHFDVYTQRANTWLMGDDIEVTQPVSALTPASIAKAARAALAEATQRAAVSIAQNRGKGRMPPAG